MSDEESIKLMLLIGAFFFGILLIASGLADVTTALTPDIILINPLDSLSVGGSGGLKATIGVILVVAVIAPQSLKVIFQR
jgi:hypothetical protein